ncbi:hypothetical protein BRADI_2g40925v3 [Brachypodium distachyon]|uniref:Uncharacterized protein n=1 Tax=Brachypodium distachyon TaxID=15368 RepID=A0A2K2DD20_BRADI|nr:hypothetical protein BRADI_2g40925v3 [Brachypodium distachyon]
MGIYPPEETDLAAPTRKPGGAAAPRRLAGWSQWLSAAELASGHDGGSVAGAAALELNSFGGDILSNLPGFVAGTAALEVPKSALSSPAADSTVILNWTE